MTMGWASKHIESLLAGETVKFRPHGNSMTPLVKSGQLCTVAPITATLEKGDILLCRVNGNQYLHLCTAVQGDRVQISNNHGHVNGWTAAVYGKLVKVED